jgi:3-isopropylmalate/(R)-2-methylmalate dehydratase small subunit
MKPFRRIEAVVAPLLRANIDTDAIIPSREMKRVSKAGLADGLFAGWRYSDAEKRIPDPGFILNQAAYAGAGILAAGANFGCGSSREHAVWALQEFGFRAIMAPGFGAIFERNCYNNGLLPLRLETSLIERIVALGAADPQRDRVEIDLEKAQLRLPDGSTTPITVPGVQREMLLNGWDPVDRTLQMAGDIADFEARDRQARPWVYAGKRGASEGPPMTQKL